MARTDLYVHQSNDQSIQARPYFTSEQWERRREEKALFIQCCVRGWFARKIVDQLKVRKFDLEHKKIEKKEKLLKEQEEKHKKEIERRMQPRTSEDFKVL